MKATGIITEYNPFHNGHIHHIKETKRITACDVLVCVMSGNFVQRGEPAIMDKWTRTRYALQHGVDLVLELPFAYATQSATQFAQGSVTTLANAHVSSIVFGSESNDLRTLKKLADLDTASYQDLMEDGLSCAKAYEIIYGKMNPNDILGINYIQAMKPYGIEPRCIERTNKYHDINITSAIASASALRHALTKQESINAYTPMSFSSSELHFLKDYYPLIQAMLLTQYSDDLKQLFMMDEGLEHQLKAQANKCDELTSFLQACTSKRYSTSRIRRTLIHLLHQTKKIEIDALPPLTHIRVLGFNDIGRAYLKELKEQEVQIASRINQLPLAYRQMELKTAQVYGLTHNRKETVEQELQPPIRL